MEKHNLKEIVTKQTQWERKLLDLSLRNMLINMRMTKAVVPLLSENLSILEDALADGEEFYVLPRPMEMDVNSKEDFSIETLSDLGSYADYIAVEGKKRRLHALYEEKDLSVALTKKVFLNKEALDEQNILPPSGLV